jgi:hypothetical protein
MAFRNHQGLDMAPDVAGKEMIEIQTGGPHDPDGSRTAAALAAYFHAEHVRAFRRLLWRRLALIALAWLLGTTVASLSANTVLAGLCVLGGGATWAGVLEWRAGRKLSALVERHRPS